MTKRLLAIALLLCLGVPAFGQLAPATPSARRPEWWASRVAGSMLTLQQYDTTTGRKIFELKNRNGTTVFDVDINGNVSSTGSLIPFTVLDVPHGGTGRATIPANSVILGNNASLVALSNVGAANQFFVIPPAGGTPAFTTMGGDITGNITAMNVAKIQGKVFPTPGAGQDGYTLTWNNAGNAYAWANYTLPTVPGILPVTKGGTGTNLATLNTGDILAANSTSTFTNITDVAAGSVLASGGIGAIPAWSATPTLTSLTATGNVGTATLSASGQVTGTGNTAGTPAYSVVGDTNTGLYFPAADTASISVGGAEQVRFQGALDATHSLQRIGTVDITGGSANGTYLGANPAAFAGDFVNYQVNGTSKYKLTNAGAVTFAGSINSTLPAANLTLGDGTGAPTYVMNGAAGTSRLLSFQTNGSTRWKFGPNGTAEGGSDAGSNFEVDGYNDSGSLLGLAMFITRSNLTVQFRGLSSGVGPPASASTSLIQLGTTAISSGSSNGTYLAANPSSYSGDFFNFQVGNASKAKLSSAGDLTSRRRISGGTAHATTDWGTLTGWGTGATCSAVSGFDGSFSATFTAGTTPSANPSAVLTFKDGTWTNSPIVVVSHGGGTGAAAAWAVTAVSATTVTIAYVGTPVASSTYTVNGIVNGR